MSSILEALKKLEADKGAQPAVEAMTPTDNTFGGTSGLLDDAGYSPQESRPVAPLLWVLGGGVFTVLIIGVSVLLVMFLLQQQSTDAPRIAQTDQATETPPAPPPIPAAAIANTAEEIPVEGVESEVPPIDVQPEPAPDMVETRVVVPVTTPEVAPEPRPAPRPRPAPEPEARPEAATSSAPIPDDIRSLPMLTRHERTQYNLDGVRLNMLNAAGPTRPLGNAFINLEKVFIGEYLPDSNAVLLDVASHGIAVEIKSTRQRYYIPR